MWLDMMIEHHEGAVEMAKSEQDDGQHKLAVDLAADIAKSQTAEIEPCRVYSTWTPPAPGGRANRRMWVRPRQVLPPRWGRAAALREQRRSRLAGEGRVEESPVLTVGEEGVGVVHGKPEQDREHQHRSERHDRHGLLDTDQFGGPSP